MGGCLTGTEDLGTSLAFNWQKAQGWCPREQGLWGALPHPAPVWHRNRLPCIRSVSILTRVAMKIFGVCTFKKPQQLNFRPALLHQIICQVATLPSPTLQNKHQQYKIKSLNRGLKQFLSLYCRAIRSQSHLFRLSSARRKI